MGYKFWIIRALNVFIGMLIILFIVELLKQNSIGDAIVSPFTWSFLATLVFISTRYYQSRKGAECALCNDTVSSKEQNNQ